MLVKGHALRGKKRRFTVIELMVTIGIMMMVLALTVPSLSGLLGGGGVSSAATSVSGQVRFARAMAISKRLYVAVIIPDGASLSKDNDNIHRCTRPAVVTRPRASKSAPFEFLYWVEDHSWNFMPPRTYVALDPGKEMDYHEIVGVDLEGLGGSDSASCIGLIMKPSGRPEKKEGKTLRAMIEVGEGFWDESEINDKGLEDNKLEVYVNANTGRVDVVEKN